MPSKEVAEWEAEKAGAAKEQAFGVMIKPDERAVRVKFAEAVSAAGISLTWASDDLETARVYQTRAPTYFELVLTLRYEKDPRETDEAAAKLHGVADAFDDAVVAIIAKKRGAPSFYSGKVLHTNDRALAARRVHPRYAKGAPDGADALTPPEYP